MAFDRGVERSARIGRPQARPGIGARAPLKRVGVPVGGVLVVLLAVLLVGALERWVAVVAVAGLGTAACELVLHRVLVRALPQHFDVVLGELYARLPLELALLLVLVVRSGQMSWTARAVVVVAVVAHLLLRTAHSAAGHAVALLEVPRAQVRGLPGVLGVRRATTPLVGGPGLQVLVAATALPALGLLWAALTGSYALVAPAAVAMALVAAAVVATSVPGLLVLARRPGHGAVLASVQEAVLRHRPQVVFYSAGFSRDLHWVTGWLDTLDELGARGRPALVLLRHPEVLEALPPSSTPILCLTEDRDVRGLALPDARVALYPVNAPDNNSVLVRRTDLRSAFVGHGDSDKTASARPTAKLYDEVWVAGEAGRDRYVRADVGLRPEQIRVVGRPQVRHVRPGTPHRPGTPWSVLYAPTWEGFDDESAGSSVRHSGREVVQRLLAMPDVRVLYRPHTLVGLRDPGHARASEDILALLARAGAPHAALLSPAVGIYEALNEADVLITDVSSVASDFIASGKPYLVVNGTDLDDQGFWTAFPSTAGASLVGRGGEGLEAALADARGPDTMRPARERLRVQLVGPPTDDPVGLFARSIDELGSTLSLRRAREEPEQPDVGGATVASTPGGAGAPRR